MLWNENSINPKLLPVTINRGLPGEALCLERVLGFKLTPDLKLNSYIRAVG